MADDDVRIGDAEREQAVQQLRGHVGSGRLDLSEFEQRIDAVYQARTRGELAAVFADLPAPAPAPVAKALSRSAPPALLRTWPAAWAQWLSVGVLTLVIWAATSLAAGHPLYFWPMWVVGPWGLGLLLGGVTGTGPRCARRSAAH
ncbi:DUF1707 SHOCT-like domain-containing protein [Pseudonocardia thermophila]|jgi:Domain of unknown function (DUF1707).|uniref:DUF1707 SHOCT-like domain-containing protein n=1 Tax=Pseudonocardia thermophila TaxID=1848 RepID=UPI00248DDEC3|nr:DUF1707 domain-containing protein [Pseudonocardia thermophila]